AVVNQISIGQPHIFNVLIVNWIKAFITDDFCDFPIVKLSFKFCRKYYFRNIFFIICTVVTLVKSVPSRRYFPAVMPLPIVFYFLFLTGVQLNVFIKRFLSENIEILTQKNLYNFSA